MPDNPAALVEVLNLPEALEQSWRNWFDRTYLPARASVPGVIAARRAVGIVGSIKDFVLYDLASESVPSSRAWQDVDARLEASESGAKELEAYREYGKSALYRQIAGSIVSGYRPPQAEIIHGAFFEAPPQHHDEFNDWYELEHIPTIVKVPGYFNARRYQDVGDENKFLALYDVVDLEVAEGKVAYDATQSPWSDRIRAKVVSARERRLFKLERLERGSPGGY